MATINQPETIALIPARSGSKRIPNKNLADIDGKPALVRAIDLAINCGVFSKIFVSTDNKSLEELALKNGSLSVGLRSAEVSNDFATTLEVVKYEIERIENSGVMIGELCCIYPLTPLLKTNRILQGLSLLSTVRGGFVFPVQELTKVKLNVVQNKDGELTLIDEMQSPPRTQDLDNVYVDAGQFYWGNRESWISQTTIFTKNSKLVLFDKWETIDVDTLEDLETVRLLFTSRKLKGPYCEVV